MFTVNGKELSAAVATIQTFASTDRVNVQASKKALRLSGANDTHAIQLVINNAEVETETEFASSCDILSGIAEGKGVLTLSHNAKSSLVEFKEAKGRYRGSFVTLPVEATNIGKADTLSITAEGVEEISHLASRIALNDIHAGNVMYYYLRLKNKELAGLCFDEQHIAFVKHKTKMKGSFDVVFPATTLGTITKLAKQYGKDDAVKMGMNESELIVTGANFKVRMPLVQPEQEQTFDFVQDYLSKLEKAGTVIVVKRKVLQEAIDSAVSLYESNFRLMIKPVDKGVEIKATSSLGKLINSIKAETKKSNGKSYAVDPHTLGDVLTACGLEEIELRMNDKVAIIADGASTYVCHLLNEVAE